MSYTKITQADLTGKGVVGLPDTPNLSTTDMQEKFDEIALDVIVPKFNTLSDELDGSGIDETIQSEDITNMRLNADMAIEVSEDGGDTWHGTASSGHRIMDGSGTIYTQESRLQFSNNVTIQDDPANSATKILIQPGEKGDPGKAATITIGDVVTGQTASVENIGSQTDAIFDFTLPKGDPGTAATIAVGTVTGGATASVINSGTSEAAVFNFVLPKGDQGDPGTGLTLLGVYATYADLVAAHPTGQRGNAYYVGDDTSGYVYLWNPDTSSWENIGELKGSKGDTGATPSLSIGTVQTGTPSAVTISGTAEYPVLNFTLEQGDKGDTGNAGTIAVGTVTSGQTASVTNVGTPEAAILDFILPKGDQGPQGNPTVVNGKSGNNITLYGDDIDFSDTDSTKISSIKSDLTGIIATGATNTTGSTIAEGSFFYLNGTLVKAKANIASGATFTENTNYEVVSDGALNELSTAKTYYATGKIASGYESASVFEGHGFVSVELHPDHTCEVRFAFTVTNTDTQNTYHGGISLTEIKTRNPNIPDIKPVTGGFMVMVDSNGIIPAETSTTGTASTENGYGMFCQSLPSLYPGFWLFARVYKTDGSTGTWGSSHFPEGTRLFGVALGTW